MSFWNKFKNPFQSVGRTIGSLFDKRKQEVPTGQGGYKPYKSQPVETMAHLFGVGDRPSSLSRTLIKPQETFDEYLKQIQEKRLKKRIAGGIKPPSTAELFPEEFGKNIAVAGIETAKELAKALPRVAKQAIYHPAWHKPALEGKEPEWDVPVLGEIDTYAKDFLKEEKEFVMQGIDQKTATIAAFLGVGGKGMLDATIIGSWLESGAKAVARKVTPALRDKIAAWKLLGQPKNSKILNKTFRQRSHQFHPDKTGGSDTAIKQINKANDILKAGGIPTSKELIEAKAGIVAGKALGPISRIMELPKSKFATLPYKMLPERAGYIPETKFEPAYKPSLGLSLRETPAKKIKTMGELMKPKRKSLEPLMEKTSNILRGTKGMTADDIMRKHPNIKLKRDVPAKDIHGNKIKIPEGESLTPYELKGNKVLLQDGETYIVSKNQFANIKGQSVSGEAKPFAPELKGTEETIRGGQDLESEIDALLADEMGQEMTRAEAKEFILQNAESEVATKYSSYQLPDGKNYKEILIKAPAAQRTDISFENFVEQYNKRFPNTGRTSEQIKVFYDQGNVIPKTGRMTSISVDKGFKSPHWDEPNVISHLRMNDRTYKGKKVSFMEELQSDWAKEGRDKGFQKIDIDAKKKYNLYRKSLEKKYKTDSYIELRKKISDNEFNKMVEMSRMFSDSGVLSHPLLKNWQEIAIKRALQEAVATDSKYFAWINGKQTSARYNLATHIKEVEWFSTANGKGVSIRPKSGSSIDIGLFDKNGIIKKADKSEWVGKRLDEVVGKGLADKIMEKKSGTLSGKGLSFGGEWASNLYDKQIKSIVQKLTGGKVEILDMGLPVEKLKTDWRIGFANNQKGSTSLTVDRLKIGERIFKDVVSESDAYIITDVLGNGKFKAKPKSKMGEVDTEIYKKTFDISTKKSAGQQAIKLTPEIKAKIKGEALKIKTSGKQFETIEKGKQAIKETGIIKHIKEKGGITVDFNGKIEKKGYAFSILDKTDEVALTMDKNFDKMFVKTFDAFKKKYGNNKNAYFGGWTEDGKFIADIVYKSNNLKESLYEGIFKRQTAIGNLAKYSEGKDGTINISKKIVDSIEPLSKGSLEASETIFKNWESVKKYYSEKNYKNTTEIDSEVISKLKKTPTKDEVFLFGVEKDITKEITKKRFSVAQRSKLKAKAEKKIEKIKTTKSILQTRRTSINTIKKHFGLSDNDLKSISRQDIRLMSNFEFKQFLDDIRTKASQFAETRQAKNEVIAQIQDKDLKKWQNLRKAMKLPPLSKMTKEQLNQFGEALEPYQSGDEFFSVRKLETVDKTDLKGIKTIREAKERLAEELGVPLSTVDNINVGILDRFRWDTNLADQNPFYKMIVDEKNKQFLIAESNYLKLEKEINDLVIKARKSRKRGLLERAVPTDKKVFEYLSSGKKAGLTKDMTDAELDLAHHLQSKFQEALDYLIKTEVLKTGRENYITHLRRGYFEAVKEDGVIKAFKEILNQHKQDEAIFNILDKDTANILPLEKFFQFSLRRSGELKPTQNIAKAATSYFRTLEKKKALDALIPKLDIYVQALTPSRMTPRGLEYDRSLKRFLNEWINTKKGRLAEPLWKQGDKIDLATRSANSFVTLLDLGFNLPVGLASAVGEQVTTYVIMGKGNYLKGIARVNTEHGKKIIKKYENYIGKSFWGELIEPSKDIGDKLLEGMFGLFRIASRQADKIQLLGSMTKEEYESGKVSIRRLAELKREKGRFRAVQGSGSIIGSTSLGKVATKYKTWAIPILNTVVKDIASLSKVLKGKQKINSKEVKELWRVLETTIFVLTVSSLVDKEDDQSFTGQLKSKLKREALTITGAMDTKMMMSAPRLLSFLENLGAAIHSIILLEEYKTKEGYKGIEKIKKMFTPRAIKQFIPVEEKTKTSVKKSKTPSLKMKPMKMKDMFKGVKVKPLRMKK